MGANTFTEVAVGATPDEAFDRIVSDARYEYGHGGYTGTIAEKHGFRQFTLPDVPGMSPSDAVDYCLANSEAVEYVRRGRSYYRDGEWVREPSVTIPIPPTAAGDLRRIADTVDDKWGDAGCFDITDTPEGKEALARWLSMQERTGAFEVDHGTGKRTRLGPEPTIAGKRVFLFFGWASS